MTEQHNKPSSDLSQDEAKLQNLFQMDHTEQPPDLIDQAILNAAHREVESENTHWFRSITRWAAFAGTAAVAVFSIAHIMTLQMPGRDSLPPSAHEEASQTISLDEDNTYEVGTLSSAEQYKLEQELRSQQAQERMALPAQPQSKQFLNAAPEVPAPAADSRQRSDNQAEASHAPEELDRVEVTGSRISRTDTEGAEPATVLRRVQEDIELEEEAESVDMAALIQHQPETPAIYADAVPAPDPEDWLRAILRWKHLDGGQQRFEQELKAFLETYPDYELPPGLQRSDSSK